MPAVPRLVVVHPLVLLSTVDHYNRVAKDTNKRVVGILLGSFTKAVVDVTNSYAVPFDEDDKNPNIWYLDHNFHENMFSMFKKVNARENVVGWYSTGPKLRGSDMGIHKVLQRYTPNPVLVIIDVQPNDLAIPTKAYIATDDPDSPSPDPTSLEAESRLTFHHIPSEIGALEAEEVGVEHLLRDIKDTSISTLASQVNNKLLSLRSLHSHLLEMHDYLDQVVTGVLPVNHNILNLIQDIFNLLPNLNVEELVRSFLVKTNDMMLAIYLASLIRSIIALHNLLNNKIANRDAERKAEKNDQEKEENKEKDKNGKDKDKDKDKDKEKDKEKEKETKDTKEQKKPSKNEESKKSSG